MRGGECMGVCEERCGVYGEYVRSERWGVYGEYVRSERWGVYGSM